MDESYAISQETIRSITEVVPKELWGKCFEEMSQVFKQYAKTFEEHKGDVQFDHTIQRAVIWVNDDARKISYFNGNTKKMDKT